MAYVSKKSAVNYVTEEITEGTAVNPSAGTQAVGVLADGFALDLEKELVERNNLSSSIGKDIPLTGLKIAAGTMAVEAKASLTEGAAPDADLLFKAALGGSRSIASNVTSTTGHSTTKINMNFADIGLFNVGDIVTIKEATAYHMSWIAAVTSQTAATLTVTGSVGVLTFTAVTAGTAGNSVEIAFADTATAGSETIGVVGTVITVGIQSGVSTVAQIKAAIDGDVGSSALVTVAIVTAGAMETYAQTALSGGAGTENSITLGVAAADAFPDSVVISKATTYYAANSGHSSLTLTTFLEDAIKIQAAGCRVSSMSLEGFETGQLASFNFGLTGLSYAETLAASGLTASFGDATPPIILSACVYVDGTAVAVNSAAFSVENTLGRITSTCSENGIIAQRITERAISGSFVPYMDTADVSWYTKFNANTQFSLFLRMWNPTATAGQYQQGVGIFIPKCVVTSSPKQDQDMVMQYGIEFQAGTDSSGTYTSDIYVGFM